MFVIAGGSRNKQVALPKVERRRSDQDKEKGEQKGGAILINAV